MTGKSQTIGDFTFSRPFLKFADTDDREFIGDRRHFYLSGGSGQLEGPVSRKSRPSPGKWPGIKSPIILRVFLESPVIFNPGIFPGNLPGNLRELECSRVRKVCGKEYFVASRQDGRRDHLVSVTCLPRANDFRQNRRKRNRLIEKYWLSREVINSLVDEFTGGDLLRDTIQYEKLFAVRENTGNLLF